MLSIDVGRFFDSVLIPHSVLDAIWEKDQKLLKDSNSICTVPSDSSKDRTIKNSSSPGPHNAIVTAKKTGQYACGGQCPNLKVCFHTLAAAEDNHDLHAFI